MEMTQYYIHLFKTFKDLNPVLDPNTRLLMLKKLQNRAARIVEKSSYDAPAATLTKELQWPTVHDMIKQETAIIVLKSISGLALTYLSTLFTRNSTWEIANFRN